MVNFNLSLTSVNVQSLSILQTLGSVPVNVNPAVISNEQSIKDFKSMVNTMLSSRSNEQFQAEMPELAAAINSNPVIKAAVYRASAVLNVMGLSQDIAVKQPAEIESNPVVNSLIQESKFTPAEKELFVKGIKAAAIEIAIRQESARTSFVMDSLIPKSNNGTQSIGGVRFLPETQPKLPENSRIQPAPVQENTKSNYSANTLPVTEIAGNIIAAAKDLHTAASFMINAIPEKTPEISGNHIIVRDKAETFNEISSKTVTLLNTAADESVKAAENPVPVNKNTASASIDKAADAINEFMISYTAFAAQLIQVNLSYGRTNIVPAEKGSNTVPAAVNNAAIEMAGGNNDSRGNRGNLTGYEIVTSQQSAINDAVSRIVNLLNEMNGSMEINRSYTFNAKLAEAQFAKIMGIEAPEVLAQNNQLMIPAEGIDINSKAGGLETLLVQEKATAASNFNEFIIKSAAYTGTFTEYMPVKNTALQGEVLPEFTKYMPAADLKTMVETKLAEDISFVKSMTSGVSGMTEAQISGAAITQSVFAQAADFAIKAKQAMVIKQVVEAVIANAVTSKTTSIKVTLRPDNLGPVTISLESRDGAVTAHMMVQNADVRDALRANAAELRDNLNKAGVTVTDFTIGLMNHNTGNGNYDARTPNKYVEWEGGVINTMKESAENTAGYTESGNGYLNLFA